MRRVAHCRAALDKIKEEFHDAIKQAVASGETYRDVAAFARLSHQRIEQIVNEK